MKIIATILLAFALSGCYQQITSHEIQRGVNFCKSENAELEKMSETFEGSTKAYCTNRKSSYV